MKLELIREIEVPSSYLKVDTKLNMIINISNNKIYFEDINNLNNSEFINLSSASSSCIEYNSKLVFITNTNGFVFTYDIIKKELNNLNLINESCETTDIISNSGIIVWADWNGIIYSYNVFDKEYKRILVREYINEENLMFSQILYSEKENLYFFCCYSFKDKMNHIIEWKYPFDKNKPKDIKLLNNFKSKLYWADYCDSTKQFIVLYSSLFGKKVVFLDRNYILRSKMGEKYGGPLINRGICWAKNGKYFAVIGDNKVKVFSNPSGVCLITLNVEYANGIKFSDDSNYISISSWRSGKIFKIIK